MFLEATGTLVLSSSFLSHDVKNEAVAIAANAKLNETGEGTI